MEEIAEIRRNGNMATASCSRHQSQRDLLCLPRGGSSDDDSWGGRIVSIAAVSARSGRANGVPYTVSEAGMVGMTQRMAYELGPRVHGERRSGRIHLH